MEVPNGRDADDYTGFADVDAVRFYRGCITEGYYMFFGSSQLFHFRHDRRGSSSLWWKIYDNQDFWITSITC